MKAELRQLARNPKFKQNIGQCGMIQTARGPAAEPVEECSEERGVCARVRVKAKTEERNTN